MKVNFFKILGMLGKVQDVASAVGAARAEIDALESQLDIGARGAGTTITLTASQCAAALRAVTPIARLARKVDG